MIDLVYLYSAGGNTNEIRYSLRSFRKHISGLGRVFIVGDDPGIFRDVTIIPMGNIHGFNLARNIYEKVLAACRHSGLSDPFMCASDDYILLHDYAAADLPFYYKGDFKNVLNGIVDSNWYKNYVQVTYDALLQKGLPTKYFNVHFPILYSKEDYVRVMGEFDWEQRKSFISKSLYANSMRISGEPIVQDKKFFTPKTKAAIVRQMTGLKFFSTNGDSLNEPMIEVLNGLFPDPDPCEL
jgi:hypothetical protein